MAEQLTVQQKQAVEDRGGKLLVSAAAGSGKTKVLVDRLMGYLTDPVAPANIDDFLMITYTKAAASELRGKIAAKLSEKIAQQPENRHLQQQLQRLYMTQISTVHSFCGELLRQFSYRLDLSADFRVADENECRELRGQVMEQILEAAYEKAGEDVNFCAFVDSQGVGRNDKQVPEILLKVYDSARCHLDPAGWLQGCLEAVETADIRDVSETRWGRYLMDSLFSYLDLQIEVMNRCADRASEAEGGEKPTALLRDAVVQLAHLRNSQTWDEIVARRRIDFGRLTFTGKFTDLELKEGIKAVRDACKAGVAASVKPFGDPSEQVLADLNASAGAVRGMVSLVEAFGKAYADAKKRRRILDFGDLEHLALDLLLGKQRSGPTAIAHEVGARFREVMVDEYQDSNAVQDAIYSALTTRGNCFMVGDVKQSIYQFRLADPGIFLEKYGSYVDADQAQPGQGRKVLLSRNFRSGGAVLSAVNCVFEKCMSPAVGGLHYGEAEALHEGVPHEPLGEPEVELYGIQVRESSYAEEAAFVARRIGELLDGTHMVRDKEGLRPIVAEDIVILLRSPGSVGEVFRSALENSGIRCNTGGGGDLLKTPEIAVLRSLLQAIHNPQLDIPLIAAMASPLFGFTADDLAAIRAGKRKMSFYDAVRCCDHPKAGVFVDTLQKFRREAQTFGLTQLMESIFSDTKIDGIYGAMEDGAAKKANLQAFYQLAVDYENGGQKDLGRFLDHLEVMEEKGLAAAADSGQGCVTIMSIHKSKGLEFPVVFLCNLARSFNKESQYDQVLCHKELGIGISAADSDRRVRYPTVAKRAISARIGEDSLSEELRVLYVAMTRAKDRLIMTYTANKLEEEICDLVSRMNMGQTELLTREVCCPGEWVLLAALGRTEAGELFKLGGKPKQTAVSEYPWLIKVVTAPEMSGAAVEEQREASLPEAVVQRMERDLAFRYAHPAATVTPSKQTATQRKGRLKDQEAAENAAEPPVRSRHWRKPTFIEKIATGRDRGNAIHGAMQYIRYDACTDECAVAAEVARLVDEGFLSAQMGKLVDCKKIANFFGTSLGKRLQAGENVLREFKFSILDEGSAFDDELAGEKILLQGVVDCALMEEDGIVVIDFKTDYVTEETLPEVSERYRPQVEAYAQALGRIFEKPVKKSCLYLFHLERFVEY